MRLKRPGRVARWALVALVALSLMAVLFVAACGGEEETTTTTAAPTTTTAAPTTTVAASDLILASTTSTQDSGLFDVLIPAFNEVYPQYSVQVIAVGSGEAMKLGENKDADVLLVHSPAAEKDFVANGFGTERRDVMYNDFIIVGPASDPAGVKGMTVATDAFKKIAESQSLFFSRADDSGTHKKELTLWEAAGITPAGDWYQSTGSGMGDTLRVASEKEGYTLADRATYLSAKDTLALDLLVEGDKALFNQYGVIPVTDATNMQGAMDFTNWITSAEGQAVIADFGVEKFGQALFVPNAAK